MQKSLTLTVAVILLAVIGLLPVLTMVAKSFVVDGAFSLKAYVGLWASAGHLLDLMGHSILLGLLVTSLATVAGVPLGVLLGKTDLPLRRTLTVLFAVPFLIPPYVTAVAWFTVLGSGGPLGRALAPATAKDVSATLFGISGCTGVLFIAFVPIVILLTIAYLGSVDPRLEDAGRLVSRWPGVLRRITLPLIAAPIHFAAVLVFLLTLGEIGVPSYFRYSVYPVEILTQFAAFYDFSAATAAALPLLVLTFAVLAFEYNLLSSRVWKLRTYVRRDARANPAWPLARSPSWHRLGVGRCQHCHPLFGVDRPILFVQRVCRGIFAGERQHPAQCRVCGDRSHFTDNPGLLLAVTSFTRERSRYGAVSMRQTLFLFTLPGTVVGIGLISLWNTPMTNFVYHTPAIIVLGYLAQYAVIPARMTSAVLARVPALWSRPRNFAARIGSRPCGRSWCHSQAGA